MFFSSLKRRSTVPSVKLELLPFLQPLPHSLLMQTSTSFLTTLLEKAATNKLLNEEKLGFLNCLAEYRSTFYPERIHPKIHEDGETHAQLMLRAKLLLQLSASNALELKAAWYNLVGLIASDLQHYQEAQGHFEAALKLASEIPPLSKASLLSNLATALAKQLHPQEALLTHKKAVACLDDLIFLRLEEKQAAAIHEAAAESFAKEQAQLKLNNFFKPWTAGATNEPEGKKNKPLIKPSPFRKI